MARKTGHDDSEVTVGVLDGKVALVTGGASGIGSATAGRFADEGARVCIVDRSEPGAEVADRLGGLFVQADVTDPDANTRMVKTCVDELGGLNVAHLNAGIICPEADPVALTDEQYRRVVAVNVDGIVFGVRAVVPAIEASGGGSVVVTASLAGLVGFPADPVYTLTKHAVVGFVRSLPEHLTPRGVTINCINPGIAATPLLGEEVIADFAAAGFPLLAPSDVADAVMRVIAGGGSGECWPIQPGREPEPFRFRRVPGPRTEGAEGMRPPGLAT